MKNPPNGAPRHSNWKMQLFDDPMYPGGSMAKTTLITAFSAPSDFAPKT